MGMFLAVMRLSDINTGQGKEFVWVQLVVVVVSCHVGMEEVFGAQGVEAVFDLWWFLLVRSEVILFIFCQFFT